MDLNTLYYNYNQCTGGSLQEFYELTLGDVLDTIITYVEINSKKKSKNKNGKAQQSIRQGEKETFMKISE